MLNNRGFTLIEMLLVMSIILVISTFSLMLHTPKLNKDDYIEQISDFFYQAKLNAIINKEKTEVNLSGNHLEYISNHHYDSLTLDKSVHCSKKSFSYNESGNIYKASSIKYYINGSQVNFVFQVGSGCFDVR